MMNPLIKYRLTKYEVTGLIAIRAQQLANNAPTTLGDDQLAQIESPTAQKIAIAELLSNRIPLKIERKYSNSNKQVFKTDELDKSTIIDVASFLHKD